MLNATQHLLSQNRAEVLDKIDNPENLDMYAALPRGLRSAAFDICKNEQVTPSSVVLALYVSLATAAQSKFSVEFRDGVRTALCVYALPQGLSGGRKTPIFNEAFKAHYDFEKDLTETRVVQEAELQPVHDIWELEMREVRKQIEIRLERGETIDNLRAKMCSVFARKPKTARPFRSIYFDATRQALLQGMFENSSSALLASDEGDLQFRTLLSRDMSMINKMWNGSTVHIDRVSGKSFTIQTPLLSMFIFSQPGLFQRFIKMNDSAAREGGLLARCYVCRPHSTIGNRFVTHRPRSSLGLDAYHHVVRKLLVSEDQPRCLVFSPTARRKLDELNDMIEGQLGPNGPLRGTSDYASKYLEKVARMAALNHISEGGDGEISLESLNQAVEANVFYAREFEAVMLETTAVSQEIRDADLLQKWLYDRLFCSNFQWVERTYVANRCPNRIRRNHLEGVLLTLVERGAVWLSSQLRTTRTGRTIEVKIVNLNLDYFHRLGPH